MIDVQAGDPPRKIKPVVVWTGKDSTLSKPAFSRCLSAAEWRKTWKAHAKEGGDIGPMPNIDFDSFMVLALFEGNGHQNYGLRIFEILDEPDGLRVRHETAYYQIGGLPQSEADELKLQTRSYAFVVVPRSDKAVTFEHGRRTTSDKPPAKWERVGTVPAVERK